MSMRTPPELRYERFLEQYVKDNQHIIRSRLEALNNECESCAKVAMINLGIESWALAAVVVFGFGLVAFTRHLWYVCIPAGIAAFFFFIRIQGMTSDVSSAAAERFVFWNHKKIIKQMLDEDERKEIDAVLREMFNQSDINERALPQYEYRIEDIKKKYRHAEEYFPYHKLQ